MKNIFFQNYIQHEILIHRQCIIIVDDDGSGVQSTGKRATAEEKNECALSNAQTKTGPMASAAFIFLNICKLR